jgi:hypothetical protein
LFTRFAEQSSGKHHNGCNELQPYGDMNQNLGKQHNGRNEFCTLVEGIENG